MYNDSVMCLHDFLVSPSIVTIFARSMGGLDVVGLSKANSTEINKEQAKAQAIGRQ